MMESYNMYGFWGPREEPPGICARRALRMLDHLAGCHELLTRWYEKAYSREAALRVEAPRTQVAMTRAIETTRMTPLESNLGYSFGWWNGADDDHEMGLRIHCGVTNPIPPWNSVSLGLPRPPERSPDLFQPDTLQRIFTAMIRAWEPDEAELASSELRSALFYPDEGPRWPTEKARVGWFTYLAERRLGGLPAEVPCEVVEMPGYGALFVLTRDHRMSAANPEDLERARELVRVLDEAGALAPIPDGPA